jgi:hypothetical protein
MQKCLDIQYSEFDIRHFLCINWLSSYTYISTFPLAGQFFLEKHTAYRRLRSIASPHCSFA